MSRGPQSSRFSANIANFIQKTKLRADLVLRKLALDGYTGLLLRSPVDTGRFRGNWRIGINSVDATADDKKSDGDIGDDDISAAETAEALAKLKDIKFGDTIHITNSVDYAIPLEDGHSPQAPGSGAILKRTFDELVAKFDRIVKQVDQEL